MREERTSCERTLQDVAALTQVARRLLHLQVRRALDVSPYTSGQVFDLRATRVRFDQGCRTTLGQILHAHICRRNDIIAIIAPKPWSILASANTSAVPHDKIRVEAERRIHHDLIYHCLVSARYSPT